jgi:peptide/nickel transport system substrate-binding protein
VAVLCVVAYFVLTALTTGTNPLGRLLPQKVSDDSITIGSTSTPKSLDIRTSSSTDSAAQQALIGNVYEGLTARNEKNEAVPGLASSWDISNDALTYTFHLRSNVTFSNGDSFTSDDVAWSLQQLIEKKYPGYDQLDHLQSVSTPDEHTVTITLSAPNPTLLWRLSTQPGLIYDKDAQGEGIAAMVGTGPFTISKWDKGSALNLTRNDSYWGSKSWFKTITFQHFATTAKAVAALTAGKIHSVLGLNTAQANALKSNKNVQIATGDTTNRATLYFNSDSTSILSDKRFRQAVRYGLDRSKIIKAAGIPATTIGGPIPSLDPGYENLTKLYPTDVAKSEKLRYYFLTRGINLVYTSSVPDAAAKSVAAQLGAEGLNVSVKKLSSAQWNEQITKKRSFDLALTTVTDSHDAGTWFTGDNWWTYDSPDADDTYNAAMSATTDSDYRSKLAKAAKMLSTESPADWLYAEKISVAWAADLTSMPSNMADQYLPLAGLAKK